MMDPAMMAQMGGGGGMPQLPGNVGIAIDEYGRPFLVMRDQVSNLDIYLSKTSFVILGNTEQTDGC